MCVSQSNHPEIVLEMLLLAVALLVGGNSLAQASFYSVLHEHGDMNVGEQLLQKLTTHLSWITTQVKERKRQNYQVRRWSRVPVNACVEE